MPRMKNTELKVAKVIKKLHETRDDEITIDIICSTIKDMDKKEIKQIIKDLKTRYRTNDIETLYFRVKDLKTHNNPKQTKKVSPTIKKRLASYFNSQNFKTKVEKDNLYKTKTKRSEFAKKFDTIW